MRKLFSVLLCLTLLISAVTAIALTLPVSATTTEEAISDPYDSDHGELSSDHVHVPKSDAWIIDEWNHYQLCECGEILNYNVHSGGTATTTELAKCDTCGTEYGNYHVHTPIENHWWASGNNHWQQCQCGEILNLSTHFGGTATATERAQCEACGDRYGDLLHVCEPMVDRWIFDDYVHYQLCSCGGHLNFANHEGGTATTTERAKCDICGAAYGDLIHEHKSFDGIWRLDDNEHYQICECGLKLNLAQHEPMDEWFFDEWSHYQTCICGMRYEGFGHFGGTATSTEQAICDVCGVYYGDLIPSHESETETDAPCVETDEQETERFVSEEEKAAQLQYTSTYYYDRLNERQQWCYVFLKDYYDNYSGERTKQRIDVTQYLPEGFTEEEATVFLRDFIYAELALRADDPVYKMMGEIGGYSAGTPEGENTLCAILDISHPDIYSPDKVARVEASIEQIVKAIGDGDRYTQLYKMAHIIGSTTFYDPYLDTINGSGHRDHALATRGHMYNQSIYGLFLEGIAVCDGFSQSVKILCNELGIPCIIMANYCHGWNLVQMENGEWYRFDMTQAVTMGWDAEPVIDGYLADAFLRNDSFSAGDYSNPYMLSLDGVALVTDFPEEAPGQYKYRGTNTDFNYTIPQSTYSAGEPTFIYKVNPDGTTCTIIDFIGKEQGDLIIPSVIDGYIVTRIEDFAFYYCTGFDGKLVIPDTVTKIGKAAFAGCYNLKSIQFSSNLSIIGEGAFIGCKGLVEITLPDSLCQLGEYAFMCCDNLKAVRVGRHVQAVGKCAIGYVDSITTVNDLIIFAPENSVMHQYATERSISFTQSGTSCDFVSADGEWHFEGDEHFHTCSHGVMIDIAAHYHEQGYLNCGDRCQICNAQKCNKYGFFESVEKIVGAHEANCISPAFTGDVVCLCENVFFRPGEFVGEPTGQHVPTGEWAFDEYQHFMYCDCGHITEQGAHRGGTATATKRAECEVCGAEYGELLSETETDPKQPDTETRNDGEETESKTETDTETETKTEIKTETETDDTTESQGQQSNSGCGGSVGAGGAVIFLISLISLTFFKKKKNA